MPIPDDDPLLDEHTERELGKRLFNMVWSLLEQPSRTAEEDGVMVNAGTRPCTTGCASASPSTRFAANGRSLGSIPSCAEESRRSNMPVDRSLCEQHGIGDFDLAFAYEALSRAHMVAGDAAEASRFATIAKTAADRIEDAEDREIFLGDLADLPLNR